MFTLIINSYVSGPHTAAECRAAVEAMGNPAWHWSPQADGSLLAVLDGTTQIIAEAVPCWPAVEI